MSEGYGGDGQRGLVMLRQRRGGVLSSLTWLGWACVGVSVAILAAITVLAGHS